MPTFADMQVSLAKNNIHDYPQKEPTHSSFYGTDNPFADLERPKMPSHQSYLTSYRDSNSSDSTLSGQFNLYIPEKDGVVSPVSGHPKGLDGIVSPIDSNEPLMPTGLFNHQPRPFLTPVEEKPEQQFHVPELAVRAPSGIDHSSPKPMPFALMPEPLRTPAFAKGASRTPSPHSRSPYEAFGTRTPSPHPTRSSFDNSTMSAQPSSRARSPLMGADKRYHHSPDSSASSGGGKLFLVPQRKFSLRDRLGDKQPPRINVEAVKQAEAHGSLTSLPGLINRALNMASNIEHGKTSSKASDWFGNDLLKELHKKGKSTASLGQVLEGFVFSPGVAQGEHQRGGGFDAQSQSSGSNSSYAEKHNHLQPPTNLQDRQYASSPPQLFNRSHSKYDYRGGPRKRRCCGLPLWLFITILVGIVAIIALAIALPLILIGNNKSKHHATVSCSVTHPCHNGGASVPSVNATCSCVCAGGFTGSDCSQSNPSSSCGSVQTSTVTGATVGANLASLFNNGESQFLVPLNASVVLPIFASNNLTCDMENALVAVGSGDETAAKGGKARRSAESLIVFGKGVEARAVESSSTTMVTLKARTTAAPSDTNPHLSALSKRQTGATTANGILIAGGGSSPASSSTASSGTTSAAATKTSSSSPSSSSSTSSNSGTAAFDPKSATTLAFARTAILYTLQISQELSVAIAAQSALQNFLTAPKAGGGDARKVDVGGGFVVDLVGESVSGGGGGMVGGVGAEG